MAKSTTKLRMRPNRHVNIPGIGLLTPGAVFEVPDEWTYHDGTKSSPGALVKTGLAEIFEDEPVLSPDGTERVRRRSTEVSS